MTNIPDVINEVYGPLWSQVAWIHAKWTVFNQLYGSEENVELLNRSAPVAFRIFQDTLLDDAILALGRLTDPARTGAYDNLSLALLAGRIDEAQHPELRARVLAVLERVRVLYRSAREHRNRRIAHTDLGAHSHNLERVLPDLSKLEIDQALEAVVELLNEIEGYFNNSETAFLPILPNDGETLVWRLRDAETYRQEQRQARTRRAQPESP